MHSYRAVLFAVVVKLCQFGSFQLSITNCYNSNTDVGTCVGKRFCPETAQIMSIDISCKNGEVCCKMFERIVTPDDSGGSPAFAAAPASSGGAAPPAGVGNGGPPTSGAAPPAGGGSGAAPPAGGGSGGSPPTGGGSGGSPSGGSSPTVGSGGPPTGGSMGPPSGGGPPGGSSPPVVGLYSIASTNLTTIDNPPTVMQNSTEVPATTQTQSPSTIVTSNSSPTNFESTSTPMSSTSAQTTAPKRFTISILVAAPPLNDSSLTPLIRNDTFTINASTLEQAAKEINEQLITINIDPQLANASDKPSQISEQIPPPKFERIVVAPDLPQNTNYEDLESVAVSAESYDRALQPLDQRCDFYYSFVETKAATPASSFRSPVVMIYAGTDSNDKEFPHMAALGYGSANAIQWLCGGSLLSHNFVITAAHCLTTQQLGTVQFVKVGTSQLNQDSSNSQVLNVIQTIPHEEYRPQTQYNDIALLQLDRSVQITEYVLPICLFSSTFYEDKNLIATGWGKTENGLPSTTLQKVALELFSNQECQNAYQFVSKQQLPLGVVDSIQICAGSRSLNSDTCQGDSGGPLQIRKNNRWYLIGITSAGLKCGVANTPAIYTRVAPYIQWIQQKIGNQ